MSSSGRDSNLGQEKFDSLVEWLDPEALPAQNRNLILQYYQEEKSAKMEVRKQLASEYGMHLNALRIRVYRIRLALQECVETCV